MGWQGGTKIDKMGIKCEPAVTSPTDRRRDDVLFEADPEVRITLVYNFFSKVIITDKQCLYDF